MSTESQNQFGDLLVFVNSRFIEIGVLNFEFKEDRNENAQLVYKNPS